MSAVSFEPGRARRAAWRWGALAAVVAGLHLGGLALLVRAAATPAPLASEEGDAVAIDLDPVEGTATPDAAEAATPADEPSEAAASSAAAAASQAAPPAPTPPIETPSTPPPDPWPPQPPPPEPPPAGAPADVAMPAPTRPAPALPVAAAPAPPSRASAPSAAAEDAAPTARRASAAREAAWRGKLVAHLNRFRRFPPGLGSGTARIGFTVDGEGRVTAASVVSGSGSAALDAAARDLVERAGPFPAPPAGVPARDLSFVVPVHYDARRP